MQLFCSIFTALPPTLKRLRSLLRTYRSSPSYLFDCISYNSPSHWPPCYSSLHSPTSGPLFFLSFHHPSPRATIPQLISEVSLTVHLNCNSSAHMNSSPFLFILFPYVISTIHIINLIKLPCGFFFFLPML